MKFLLATVGLFFNLTVSGQVPTRIDSLRQVVITQKDNIGKIENLTELARFYFRRNNDSCLYFFKKVHELSFKLNYQEGLVDAYFAYATLFRDRLLYDSAVYYNNLSAEIAASLNDSTRLAKVYYNQAYIYIMENNTRSSTASLRRALVFFQANGQQTGIMACYNGIAKNFSRLSLFDSAAIYYHKALDLAQATGDRMNMGVIYDNLNQMYTELDQYDDAVRYIERAMEIYKEFGKQKEVAQLYHSLACVDVYREDYKEALKYNLIADSLCTAMNILILDVDIQNTMGLIYGYLGKPDLALQSYLRALEGYREMNLSRGMQTTLNNISVYYNRMGLYDKALAYADSSLELSYVTGELEPRKKVLMNLAEIYEGMGLYKTALEFNKKFEDLEDSIYNLDKDHLINDLSMQYENEKKEAEILALENENLEKDLELRKRTSQRNAYFFGGLSLVALAIFVVLYFRQRAAKDKVIAMQKIRQLEEEKKLMAAKFLVEGQEEERKRIARELHDGLGVLLSATKLQFTTLKDNSPENHEIIRKATELLEQATGDVRKISHNMMPGLLTKLGLYEALEDLFETINDKGELQARCTIVEDPPRLPENKEIMLYRIVQELVNNTLKHAGAKNIEFGIKVTDQSLDIEYTDDGKGFDLSTLDDSKSLGLNSMKSRLNFLNGKIDLQTSPGNGVRYFIRVPV